MILNKYISSKLGPNTMLWIGGVLVCILGLMGFFIFHSERNVLLLEASRKVKTINAIAWDDFFILMPSGHVKELREHYKALIKSGAVVDIHLIRGKPVERQFGAKTMEKPLDVYAQKALMGEPSEIIEILPSGRALRQLFPIRIQKLCLKCHRAKIGEIAGARDTTISLSKIDKTIQRRQKELFLITFFCVSVVMVTLYYLMRKKVLLPVEDLVHATKQVAKGNLNYQIQPRSNDEMGTLASAFNQMTQDLKKSQENLLKAERLATVGELAAGIAHEIGNPISSLKCFVQLLQEEEQKGKGKIRFTEEMLHEINRASRIIRDLLDYARPKKMEMQPVSVNSVLEESLKILSSQPTFKNITLKTFFERNLPVIQGDKNALQQAFVNILLNAVQAMPEGGNLDISTLYDADKKQLILSFKDTGHGIPEDTLAKVFEPFFTTKETGAGTGLGLSVSQKIVKSHAGDILVESEEGKGTRFTLIFPEGG